MDALGMQEMILMKISQCDCLEQVDCVCCIFLCSTMGDRTGLSALAEEAASVGKYNVAFLAQFLQVTTAESSVSDLIL
jgi:hypothetical protein